MQRIFKILFFLIILNTNFANSISAENTSKLLTTDWSFKGPFGKFDRASLQRGYQVYNEVCASCHSLKYVSYRNLSEKGGPEFSVKEAKAIAASFEITDGPNQDGEMFTRPAKLSDKFVMPYSNEEEAKSANGGAYPPDMSVLVKARAGGADYIYSVLLGYVGAMPAEGLYLLIARVATAYYFLHFLLILPILGKIEKTTPLPLSITSPVLGGSADLAMAKNTDVRKEKL